MRRINNPKHYLYHRIISHPTKGCFNLKDKIHTLVEADMLCLSTKQKNVAANIISLQFGKEPEVQRQNGIMVPRIEMLLVNLEPIVSKAQGLTPILIGRMT